jgi:hypothetical protein
MVEFKGRYNMMLGRDWIHANECVLSTLHQCMAQWVDNHVEVIRADEEACVVMAET